MKSFKLFLLASLIILFSSVLQGSDADCIPDERTEQGTGVIIDGVCVDPPTLPYPDIHDCGDDLKLIQGTENNCMDGTEAADPGPYPPAIDCPAGKTVDQGSGECTLDIPSTDEPLPANITIDIAALQKAIGSIFDNTPYPIDIQGIIDADGMTVTIPYTVTTAPVTLPARSSSVTLDASVTQDNESGIIATLSWTEQYSLSVGSGTFTATLTIDDSAGNDDGIYNAKKLDIQEDIAGLLAATFPYAIDNTGVAGALQLKIYPGIPDRMFGTVDNNRDANTHMFLYLPITNATTEETWLSNNLGANYANMNSSEFNITKQAIALTDHNAYGSFFQWGRKADGHELINWTGAFLGTAVNGTTTTQSNDPTDALFINVWFDWRVTQDDTLWASESSQNNVCPAGYRVPTGDIGGELDQERQSWGSNDDEGALAGTLALPMTGYRMNTTGSIDNISSYSEYWGSTVDGETACRLSVERSDALMLVHRRSFGFSVRCIKD